jgi:hypothetical protein
MDQQLICELSLAMIPVTELASRHITFAVVSSLRGIFCWNGTRQTDRDDRRLRTGGTRESYKAGAFRRRMHQRIPR